MYMTTSQQSIASIQPALRAIQMFRAVLASYFVTNVLLANQAVKRQTLQTQYGEVSVIKETVYRVLIMQTAHA